MNSVSDFFDFVQHAPTAFHAAQTTAQLLQAQGYTPLQESEDWQLQPGKGYFVTRNQSAVVAFQIPESGKAPFQIVASHADSPMLKLKPQFEDVVGDHYLRLNVAPYGGLLMSTWLDRPLSVAGRLLVKTDDGMETVLTDLRRDALVIPNQPIHFNREANNGYAYNAQVDLLPLWGEPSDQKLLMAQLCENAGVSPESMMGHDLFQYNRMPGSQWGAQNQFISCPRIDDLECAWTSLQAFLQSVPEAHISVWAMLDNEEVGSGSKQGADSTLLSDTFHRILTALDATDAVARRLIASSMMVSADNAHAVHPNHLEKYDAQNRTWMNQGIVIKHSANQKYTTDGVSSAIFSELCSRAHVPVQHFANRSDLAGGSTLGNIANTHVSMNTVDIGLAQLAMHSSWETAGADDLDAMICGLRSFYQTDLQMKADGSWRF